MVQLGKWYVSREHTARLFFPFGQTEDVALGFRIPFDMWKLENVELKAMLQAILKEHHKQTEQNETIHKINRSIVKKIFQLSRGDFAYIGEL